MQAYGKLTANVVEFKREEVDAAGDDLASAREGAGNRGSVAGECGDYGSCFQVPHLQRLVTRRGDRTPPIPAHRHAPDPARVAGEGAHERRAGRMEGGP